MFHTRGRVQLFSAVFLLVFLGACTHRVEIEGSGDVVSASGDNDCDAGSAPCEFLISDGYQESYVAEPADGYVFSEWVGCLSVSESTCSFDVEADTVRDNWGRLYTSRAIFLPALQRVLNDANGSSGQPRLSANGQFLVFSSDASNLIDSDSNNASDIFLLNRDTGLVRRLSQAIDGSDANGGSFLPEISSDGQYVVWHSSASNLVENDSNGVSDVFLYSLADQSIELISKNTTGAPGDSGSMSASVSDRGRFVVYESNASNLVSGDTNITSDIFLYARESGVTSRISVDSDGNAGQSRGSQSANAAISADGRWVVFDSFAPLVSGDVNNRNDVFLRDLIANTTIRLSVSADGGDANGGSRNPAIDAVGSVVVFESDASNLVDGDDNGSTDIFLLTLPGGGTELISRSADGIPGDDASVAPQLDSTGAAVIFSSFAANLSVEDSNEAQDVFRYSRAEGTLDVVSDRIDGEAANGASRSAALANNGQMAVFLSDANNLADDDENSAADVFIRLYQ